MKSEYKIIFPVLFVILIVLGINISYSVDEYVQSGSISASSCAAGGASCIIYYDSNGGNELENDAISSHLETDTSFPVPEKDGYTFDGWYYDKEFTKKVTVDSYRDIDYTPKKDEKGCTVADEVTLYAKWIELKTGSDSDTSYICHMSVSPYKIVYNTNGGNKIESFSHCGGCAYAEVPMLPVPKRNGYKFDGWYYDKSLKNKVTVGNALDVTYTKRYDEKGCVTQDTVNLYAKWKKITTQETESSEKEKVSCSQSGAFFEIIYNSNNGEDVPIYVYSEKVKEMKHPVPTRDGYEFLGWYYDNTYNKKVSTDIASEIEYVQEYDNLGCSKLTTITLFAKWNKIEIVDNEIKKDELNKYKIIYNTNGGKKILEDNIYYDSKTETLIEEPTREGYKFLGWYYDSKFTKKVTVKHLEKIGEEGKVLGVTDTINLYAKWEKEKDIEKISILWIIIGGIILLVLVIVIVLVVKKRRKKENDEDVIEILGL